MTDQISRYLHIYLVEDGVEYHASRDTADSNIPQYLGFQYFIFTWRQETGAGGLLHSLAQNFFYISAWCKTLYRNFSRHIVCLTRANEMLISVLGGLQHMAYWPFGLLLSPLQISLSQVWSYGAYTYIQHTSNLWEWNNTLEKFIIVWWPDRFLEDLADTGTQGLNKTVPKHQFLTSSIGGL